MQDDLVRFGQTWFSLGVMHKVDNDDGATNRSSFNNLLSFIYWLSPLPFKLYMSIVNDSLACWRIVNTSFPFSESFPCHLRWHPRRKESSASNLTAYSVMLVAKLLDFFYNVDVSSLEPRSFFCQIGGDTVSVSTFLIIRDMVIMEVLRLQLQSWMRCSRLWSIMSYSCLLVYWRLWFFALIQDLFSPRCSSFIGCPQTRRKTRA